MVHKNATVYRSLMPDAQRGKHNYISSKQKQSIKRHSKEQCLKFASETGKEAAFEMNELEWLFHAMDAATGKARSPRDDRWVGDTRNVKPSANYRQQWTATSVVKWRLSASDKAALCPRRSGPQTHTHTQPELDPLWRSSPVDFAEPQCDVIGPPRKENQPSSGVQDRPEPVNEVTRYATQYRVAIVNLADHREHELWSARRDEKGNTSYAANQPGARKTTVAMS